MNATTQISRPMEITVINGRTWQIGPDGTLLDRRRTPQDGIRLNHGERVVLQLVRICGRLPLGEIQDSLLRMGYITEQGTPTSSGRLMADILLADPNDSDVVRSVAEKI